MDSLNELLHAYQTNRQRVTRVLDDLRSWHEHHLPIVLRLKGDDERARLASAARFLLYTAGLDTPLMHSADFPALFADAVGALRNDAEEVATLSGEMVKDRDAGVFAQAPSYVPDTAFRGMQ